MLDEKELLGVMIAIAVLFVTISFIAIYQHELAHQQIYNAYGIKSEVEWTVLKATTSPIDSNTSISESDTKIMNALHATNEVYGYQIITIVCLVTSYTIIIAMLTIMKQTTSGEI